MAALDGAGHGGDVIAGLSIGKDGLVYGAAAAGGANGRGTVFRVDPATSLLSVIHAFDDSDTDGGKQPEATPVWRDGQVLGTTYYGRIYRMAPDGSAYETLFPGQTGNFVFTGGVTPDSAGNLWGAAFGGDQGVGQLWEITSAGVFKWRQAFSADEAQDGLNPTGTLAKGPRHTFYGVTQRGGDATCYCGAVFSATPGRGGLQVVHDLVSATDGADPEAGLVADAAGRLYGVTMRAGASGGGTLFRITPPMN